MPNQFLWLPLVDSPAGSSCTLTTFGFTRKLNVENQDMEITSIHTGVLDSLIKNLKDLTKEAEIICRNEDYTLQVWLDNQDVCEILNVSKRTLQSYRDTGRLAYSRIDRKIFYKPEDVDVFINNFLSTKK